ncbi:MAG TPA: hypothetical protein VE175_13995 [Woeseiaceae bacterium]|nr:hypothetical protein [Woeseiaceae bacterium]
MHISRTICIAAVLGLAACASQSAYRAADDPDDHGYYSRTLGNDRYIVGYNGSSTMSENLVKDYALFRAAELTMQEGKDWFRVVERESRSVETPTAGVSVTRHDSDYVVQRNCGLLGCSSRVRPVMHTSMGIDSGSGRTVWSSRLEIVMGIGPMPEEGGSVYEADALMKSLMAGM